LPIEADEGRVTGELRSITKGAAEEYWPTLSADGKKLGSMSLRLNNPDIWVRDFQTGNEEALTASSGRKYYPPVATIGLFDLSTRRNIEILRRDRCSLFRGHFSPDERWLVFHAYETAGEAREFIAPFRGADRIPESEWIPVTDGKAYTDAPRWSPNGNLIYYVSDRDGFRCIWAQRLEPLTKRPLGNPFAVQHFHQRRRSLRDVEVSALDLAVAGGRLVFPMVERKGNIWMADFGKSLP
jgi:eukaryotic-like serine/threonine-protein kinase